MFSKPNKPTALNRTSPSIIGTNCSLAGDILSDGEVHIDGQVVGDVRCVTLVIGEAGGVTGEIVAETVRVLGSVTGQIAANAVELARSARIIGDITHDSLSVEAGAHVEGRFNRRPAGTVQSLEAPAARDSSADEAPPSANVIMLGN